jgi:hypothetical protein
MMVPKSPSDPASSDRENFIGIAGFSDTVSAGLCKGTVQFTGVLVIYL